MSTSIHAKLKRAQRITQRLLSGLLQHVVRAAQQLDGELVIDAPSTVDTAATVRATATTLEARLKAYAEAVAALAVDEAETSQARSDRDVRVAALRAMLSDLAALVRLLYGEEAVARLGLSGATPRSLEELVVYAARFVDLTARGFGLPQEGRNAMVQADFGAMRAEVVAHLDGLKAALSLVSAEERQDQAARVTRDRLFGAWETQARFARDLARALLTRAGEPELAARLLPSDRQIDGVEPLSDGPDGAEPSDPA